MSETDPIPEIGKHSAVESAAATEWTASEEKDLAAFLNQGYVCPPESGPAWRAAWEAGVDMGLVEDSLRMRPMERLREHQRALNQILALAVARASNDSRS